MAFQLLKIAEVIGGEVVGDGSIEITGLAKIQEAEAGDLTFLSNPKYAKFLKETKASAVIVPPETEQQEGLSLIRMKNPYFGFLKSVELFYPPKQLIEKGIHESAIIGEGTHVGENISIGPYVVIGKQCHIGPNTVLMPGVVVGDNVLIGEDCLIHANVSIRGEVAIGNRVIIHDGTVIGSDGFGFALENGVYYKIPQVGTVVIEDDVEIGANVTIDRASIGETRIKKGAKLDNLIQIAHNCTVGENTVIAAQTGISGSTQIGAGVRIGGQVGFAGHLHVGDGAAVAAQSGVSKSVPPGMMVFGYPARPHNEELRIQAARQKLPELLKIIKELKEKIEKLEEERK